MKCLDLLAHDDDVSEMMFLKTSLAVVSLITAGMVASTATSQTAYRAPWLREVANGLRTRQTDNTTYTNRTSRPLHPLRPAHLRPAILDGNYADPWLFSFNNSYYLLPTMPDGSVSIFKSDTLADFHGAEPTLLWMPPNPPVWAPEMHVVDGELYVYGALQDGEGDAGHR